MTGYTLDEVMLTPWTLVMSGRKVNNLETRSLNEAFTKGLTMTYVLTCYKKNGASFCNHILIMHVGVVQHRNDQLSTFCIMMREIPLVLPSSSSCSVTIPKKSPRTLVVSTSFSKSTAQNRFGYRAATTRSPPVSPRKLTFCCAPTPAFPRLPPTEPGPRRSTKILCSASK